MKNAVLRVSALGNAIYLCKVSKTNPNLVVGNKVDFTNQAIGAVIQHMQSMPRGKDCYEVEGVGRLVWESLPQAIDAAEQAQAEGGTNHDL